MKSAVLAFAVLASAMWMPAGGASPLGDPVVSPEFAVADLGIRFAPADQTQPSIAYDGTNYLVVWSDTRGDNGDVYGARVRPDGSVLDVGGIAISTAPNSQLSPDVAFDGTNYLVTWSDSRRAWDRYDVYAARVTPGGSVLDPAGIPVSAEFNFDQTSPRLAFDGTNYLVVWTDGRFWPDPGAVFGARVTPSGTVLDPQGFAVSSAPNGQFAGGIAFDGENYLVSWTDLRSGPPDVYVARVTPAATVLDPNGIPVSTASGGQYASDIAFDGTNYLVVWDDGRSGLFDVYGARVSREGLVLDAGGIPISTDSSHQQLPSVAFDGTNYFVAWTDARSPWDIYGARVTPAGGVLDAGGIPISTADNDQLSPAVGFDGGNFLVVWQDDRVSRDPYNEETYGARVTSDGEVLDTDGIGLSIMHASQTYPAVAFDGTNYLVAWQDDRSGTGSAGEAHDDIYAARVTQDGTSLDGTGIAVATAPSVQGYFPSVAFDGTNYLVVWADSRHPLDSDIYGARVTPAGEVLDEGGFVISEAFSFQFTPTVAFDGRTTSSPGPTTEATRTATSTRPESHPGEMSSIRREYPSTSARTGRGPGPSPPVEGTTSSFGGTLVRTGSRRTSTERV